MQQQAHVKVIAAVSESTVARTGVKALLALRHTSPCPVMLLLLLPLLVCLCSSSQQLAGPLTRISLLDTNTKCCCMTKTPQLLLHCLCCNC